MIGRGARCVGICRHIEGADPGRVTAYGRPRSRRSVPARWIHTGREQPDISAWFAYTGDLNFKNKFVYSCRTIIPLQMTVIGWILFPFFVLGILGLLGNGLKCVLHIDEWSELWKKDDDPIQPDPPKSEDTTNENIPFFNINITIKYDDKDEKE